MYHFQLYGKTKGAIGISHRLPCMDLPNQEPYSAENARLIYEKYDHVTPSLVRGGACDRCGKACGVAQ